VNSVAFSDDGKRAVTASDDNTVRIWSAENGNQIAVLIGHSGRVWRGVYGRRQAGGDSVR
jgi:WD40 repeat protein